MELLNTKNISIMKETVINTAANLYELVCRLEDIERVNFLSVEEKVILSKSYELLTLLWDELENYNN